MKNAEPRAIIVNILDRAAATSVPFWEPPAEERQRVADLLGAPEVGVEIHDAADGSTKATGTAAPFLALAILNEVAIELIGRQSATAIGREEAIFQIRERVAELLADEDD